MRAVIQRVNKSIVHIENNEYAKIGKGLLLFLGIELSDTIEDIQWLTQKIINLRIFSDESDLMNLSVTDIKGEILVVSQFTLFASTKKGNRPSFMHSAKPDVAIPLYTLFVTHLKEISKVEIKTGIFGADMQVEILNDGPVTILIDTKNKE